MSVSVRGQDWLARITIGRIMLLALVLRLAWALIVPIAPVSDPSVYDMLAQRIAAGHGYSWPDGSPTAYWPVGTSALYSLVYAIFGRNLLIVAIVNAMMGALLTGAIFALARTQFSRCASLVAALVAALWPSWIAFTSIMSSELPTNLFFVSGLAVALSRRGAWWGRVILSSALLVGATYCRANMLPFILFAPLLVAIRDCRARQIPGQFLRQSALALVVAALMIAPWATRNLHSFGAVVPISTNFGVNLWIGNNPDADGGFTAAPPVSDAPLPKNEVAQDRLYQRHAKAYIAAHPGRYLELCVRRLIVALDRETYGVGWNEKGLADAAKTPLKIMMSGYWYGVFLLSLAGLALFVWRRPLNLLSPFVLVPMATMAAPVLVMSSERYHYAIAPFVAIFAAYLLTELSAARRASSAEAPLSA